MRSLHLMVPLLFPVKLHEWHLIHLFFPATRRMTSAHDDLHSSFLSDEEGSRVKPGRLTLANPKVRAKFSWI